MAPSVRAIACGTGVVASSLSAIGLILPPLTGIAPVLALAAATGLVLIGVGGSVLPLSRGETRVIGSNIVLLALACVATWLATIWS